MTQTQVDELYRDPVLAPLTDRAIAGALPDRLDLQAHHRDRGAGKRRR